jgi:cobalt/nickel transport system permease protein
MAEMKIPGWLREAGGGAHGKEAAFKSEGFIDRTLGNIASFMKETIENGECCRSGVLQSIEPRARMAGMFFLVFAAGLSGKVWMLFAVISLTAILALLSGVRMGRLLRRIMPALVFTAIIVAPISLSFFTPGSAIFNIGGAAVTREGIETGLFIIARVGTMSGLAALLLLSTRQADLFRGLRGLVPSFFVTALFMTYRYVFILMKTAEDMALARRSRTISGTNIREAQGWFASRIGLMLRKTAAIADEVTLAMVSRGFDGKIRTFESKGMRGKDLLFIGITSFVLFLAIGL